MTYTGKLYFEDGDSIIVPSLIVRSNLEIAFSLVANWGGQGKWSKSGIAVFDGQKYVSDEKPAIQVETGEKGPFCKITFSKIEKVDDYLSIDGNWHEKGESYMFEGDLEAQS